MKNKKLLILLCIPIIIVVMVLPLCSFTTIKDTPQYKVMNPWFKIDVEYVYHRVTSTLDEKYYGYIPSFNQLLTNEAENLWSTNRASDYILVSNESLNYSTSGTNRNRYVNLTSEDINIGYFTGKFKMTGLFALDFDDISIIFDDSYISFTPYLNTVTYDVIVEGFAYNNDGMPFAITQFYTVSTSDNGQIYFDSLFNDLKEDYNDLVLQGCVFINEINFIPRNYGSENYLTVNSIFNYYEDEEVQNKTRNMLEDVVENVNNFSFWNGYYEGQSIGESTWESFTDFLTTTIGGFLNFEFVENISFGSIFAVFISIGLVIAFLKIFAGG